MRNIIEKLFPADQSAIAILGTAWLTILAISLAFVGALALILLAIWGIQAIKKKNQGKEGSAAGEADSTEHVAMRLDCAEGELPRSMNIDWKDVEVTLGRTTGLSLTFSIALSLGGAHAISGIGQAVLWLAANNPPSRILALVHSIHTVMFGVAAFVLYIRFCKYTVAETSLRNICYWLISVAKNEYEAAEAFGTAVCVICTIASDMPAWLIPYASAEDELDIDKGHAAVDDALRELFNPKTGTSEYFCLPVATQKTIASLSSLAGRNQIVR
jgi:hypothetical protein